MEPWNPPVEISEAEQRILKLCKKQKLWAFLRQYRHLLLSDEVRLALRGMYAESGRGDPRCPEQLALALVLQVGFQVADHEVPALTVVDQRWRMVLDFQGDEPAFSQGTIFNFRERAMEHGFIRVLLDRTVELARETRGFSHKRLRMLIDSSPLLGAGRVEDTFNLLGRAVAKLVGVAATEAGQTTEQVAEQLELSIVSAKSVKAALDVDWRTPEARSEALNALLEQLERLRHWLMDTFDATQLETPPLSDAVALVEALVDQDTEPDPDGPAGTRRIKQGGSNRRISISDADMRHGRKSKTKLFTGFKRHVSVDADLVPLIVGTHLVPANVQDHEGAEPLLVDAERQGLAVDEVQHDRGYLPSEALRTRRHAGLRVITKPPTPPRTHERFNKSDFNIDLQAGTVTCRSGRVASIRWNLKTPAASFSKSGCTGCTWWDRCQSTKKERRVTIHPDELFFQQMARELASEDGRRLRRERIAVEHALARLDHVQGKRARFLGLRKNQFHTSACAVVANCYVLDRLLAA